MEKNAVEIIIFNGKKWLNEKHIETQLEHSNLVAVTNKYSPELRKTRQELQICGNYQHCRRFLEEDFAMQIMPIMTQEQSILSKIVTLFSAEEIILQYNLLGYRTDAYFSRYKLAIEVDEQEHNDRDIDYEIERQKSIEKNLIVNLLKLIQAKKMLIPF